MARLRQLIVYRGIMQDPVMAAVQEMLDCEYARQRMDKACELAGRLIEKAEQYLLEGNIMEAWIWHLILNDVNPFSLDCERRSAGDSGSLYQAVLWDMGILKSVVAKVQEELESAGLQKITRQYVRDTKGKDGRLPARRRRDILAGFLQTLSFADPACQASSIADAAKEYYETNGCGVMAMYPMFRWSQTRGLVGIEYYDDIRLSDLVGYEYQKRTLIENTSSFVKGRPANNVLLAGAGGTGKSSSVKALVNEYFEDGLRLLEMGKEQMPLLPDVMKFLTGRGKRFILFIDDLSFEDQETDYKYIKSLLEGSAEKKPDNVIFYATSNRRHIIQQKWKDRDLNHMDEEVHGIEAMNEKLSLSQRFGITLTYPVPKQDEYLEIVSHMAAELGVNGDAQELRQKALQWALDQKGFSGRSARQFISAYAAQKQSEGRP